MLRYPWVDARAALEALAADQPALDAVQVTYVNPETGGDAENILGFYALMLRAGQTLRLPARSPAMVFHLIEGAVDVSRRRAVLRAGRGRHLLRSRLHRRRRWSTARRSAPAFVFIADETPLHRKLGVFENRG